MYSTNTDGRLRARVLARAGCVGDSAGQVRDPARVLGHSVLPDVRGGSTGYLQAYGRTSCNECSGDDFVLNIFQHSKSLHKVWIVLSDSDNHLINVFSTILKKK